MSVECLKKSYLYSQSETEKREIESIARECIVSFQTNFIVSAYGGQQIVAEERLHAVRLFSCLL